MNIQHTSSTKPMSNRQLKVGETIKRALSDVIRHDIHDPRLEKISIIISEVRMTPDLKLANVYLLPMIGTEMDNKAFMLSIKDLTHQIRYALAKRVKLRYMPEIKFILDSSFEQASKLDNLLKK